MKYAKQVNRSWRVEQISGSGTVAEAQAAILLAQGYKPVREAERPADTPFMIWSASYAVDGTEVAETWWSAPLVIRLSRDKLIGAATTGGWLEAAMAYFATDPAAQDWWANSMNYVEGSPMAARAMEALGLTLEQAHALVLQCKE